MARKGDEMINQIFSTLQKIDANVKRADVLMDKDISLTVILDINGSHTKWTDNEKGYITDDIYRNHFNGSLADCLRYLQKFQIKPSYEPYVSRARVDLNEIKYDLESEAV